MPLELSKNLVCLYYSFVATELVLAPNNKCHSVRSRDSVTALNRATVERRCDPSAAVRPPPRRRRKPFATSTRDLGAAMAHNQLDPDERRRRATSTYAPPNTKPTSPSSGTAAR